VGAFTPNLPVLLRTFTEWRVILGFALIFSGALFWLGVISRADFSFAYPLLALSYVVAMIPARFILHEDVTFNRILGAIIVVVGAIVISWER
jgi:drug/metabolite transporter (DMT)-like permease